MENRCYNVHVLTESYASSVNSSLPPVQQTLSCQLVGQAIGEATLDHGQKQSLEPHKRTPNLIKSSRCINWKENLHRLSYEVAYLRFPKRDFSHPEQIYYRPSSRYVSTRHVESRWKVEVASHLLLNF